MRWSDFNGSDLMVSLSRFGGLTVRPWATSFFSIVAIAKPRLLEIADAYDELQD
jgi:hypothetical protein